MLLVPSTRPGEGDPVTRWPWTRPPVHDDHTEDVIRDAERTRKDLKRLTTQLAEYTADLRAAVVCLETRENEGRDPDGRP
jgi:hypothetical protein